MSQQKYRPLLKASGGKRFDLTEEQRLLVEVDNRSDFLVSASAGSGKTRVLSQRISERIKNSQISDIRRVLVLTYTEAAAQEMRQRIQLEIERELSGSDAELLSDECREALLHAYDHISEARISTIHSFAKSLLDEFFYLGGESDPEFRYRPSAQLIEGHSAQDIYSRVVELLFNDISRSADAFVHGEQQDPRTAIRIDSEERLAVFHKFLDFYGSWRGEKQLHDAILVFYHKLRSRPNYLQQLDRGLEIAREASQNFLGSVIAEAWYEELRYQRDRIKSSQTLKRLESFSANIPEFPDPKDHNFNYMIFSDIAIALISSIYTQIDAEIESIGGLEASNHEAIRELLCYFQPWLELAYQYIIIAMRSKKALDWSFLYSPENMKLMSALARGQFRVPVNGEDLERGARDLLACQKQLLSALESDALSSKFINRKKLSQNLDAVHSPLSRLMNHFAFLLGVIPPDSYRSVFLVNSTLSLSFFEAPEVIEARLQDLVKLLSFLVEIIHNYERQLNEEKRRGNFVDYSDFLQMADRLLDNPEVRTSLNARFEEVYIDEYQDTSEIQDRLIAKFAEGKRFMVGDIKQSIYSFQDARPENFLNKLENYPLYSGESNRCEQPAHGSIRLNFRSDGGILDFVNNIFSTLMTKNFGGLDYDEEQWIEANQRSNDGPCVHICSISYSKVMNAKNMRAKALARYVRYLHEAKQYRYSDIAILCRKNSDISMVASYLTEQGISLDLSQKTGLDFKTFGTTESISTCEREIHAWLRVLQNPQQDPSLIAYLSSGLTHEILTDYDFLQLKILMKHYHFEREYFYQGLRDFIYFKDLEALDGLPVERQEILQKQVRNNLKSLETLRKRLQFESLNDVLLSEIKVLKYRELLSLRLNAEAELEFFDGFVNSLFDIEEQGTLSTMLNLSALVYSLNRNFSKGMLVAKNHSADREAVTLKSFHASKGLEFKHVILFLSEPYFVQPSPTTDAENTFVLDDQLGLSARYKRGLDSPYDTDLVMDLYALRQKREYYGEELRLLYVAMTRAKENLYVMGYDFDSLASYAPEDWPEALYCGFTPLDWIKSAMAFRGIYALNSNSLTRHTILDERAVDDRPKSNPMRQDVYEIENYSTASSYCEYVTITDLGQKLNEELENSGKVDLDEETQNRMHAASELTAKIEEVSNKDMLRVGFSAYRKQLKEAWEELDQTDKPETVTTETSLPQRMMMYRVKTILDRFKQDSRKQRHLPVSEETLSQILDVSPQYELRSISEYQKRWFGEDSELDIEPRIASKEVDLFRSVMKVLNLELLAEAENLEAVLMDEIRRIRKFTHLRSKFTRPQDLEIQHFLDFFSTEVGQRLLEAARRQANAVGKVFIYRGQNFLRRVPKEITDAMQHMPGLLHRQSSLQGCIDLCFLDFDPSVQEEAERGRLYFVIYSGMIRTPEERKTRSRWIRKFYQREMLWYEDMLISNFNIPSREQLQAYVFDMQAGLFRLNEGQ
ncbi:MAG: UvrD-helicase domain-containing protein [Eubacteriales bacterium]|nr:UvrD-helicase domain-containing protein [Eubacteriales bacterium]